MFHLSVFDMCALLLVVVLLCNTLYHFFILKSFKVYLILDEFILAGELQETSKKVCIFLETFNFYFMLMVVWLI